MTGAKPMTGIPMKIFIEQQEILVPRLLIEPVMLTMQRAAACRISPEQTDNPLRKVIRYLFQGLLFPCPGRILYHQAIPIELAILPDRLDDQIVDRYPNRPPPVGISAEEVGSRISRIILDMIIDPTDIDVIGVFLMIFR